MRKLIYFIFVGGVGFIIDGGLLTLFSHIYLLNIYLSRLMSFSVAALITWSLNRTLVFKYDVDPAMRKPIEYTRYLVVQICGALTNLLVFTLLIETHPLLRATPIIPLFIGAFFGLFFNFTGARYWVFRKRHSKELNV